MSRISSTRSHQGSLSRSFINGIIDESREILAQAGFYLPPFATWTPEHWHKLGGEFAHVRAAKLGWDVTDFGLGNFFHTGRVLFTLRNGESGFGSTEKPYAEKIILGRHGQRAPRHYHINKIEDIINRGGGEVVLQLAPSEHGEKPPAVFRDGQRIVLTGPCEIRLAPGESLCIPPGITHQFWGEETVAGKIPLIGEVSSFCDDINDNVFLQDVIRFCPIIEDEAPRYTLCNEIPASAASLVTI